MTLVVDASALIAAIAEQDAVGLWAEEALEGERLAGPALLLAEGSNILRRLEHRGDLSRTDATDAHRSLMRNRVSLLPFPPFADRVWELRENLTSYDAWYVAIAEALDCPLVTLDLRLSRAPGPTCAFVTPPGEA
ncbi:MAG: type II toxin-antitoxin system VapC family toxin [Chloroflexi bacterium]|nr:type II toxin-antitoxin system VapC family toxin [Chloroflexota bacterium]